MAVSNLVRPAPVSAPPRRVAMIVVHSNPLREPGSGDAGGMTVYIREIAQALRPLGVSVDVYTRQDSSNLEPTELAEGVQVWPVPAGPPNLRKEELSSYLPEFTANLLERIEGGPYDLIHSHYWLSGRVASRVAQRIGVPFVHTFHSLGKVGGKLVEAPVSTELRVAGEAKVMSEADAIVASTPGERDWLIDLYAAHPEKIHLIPPGVDHSIFSPADPTEARKALGLDGKKALLFVGRLQPLKAADTALRAFGQLIDWGRLSKDESRLIVVGGPSGESGAEELEGLRQLAKSLDIEDAVRFEGPKLQKELPAFYRAADVCLVPSHSETFGLVALEAQACGVPVVASSVGGLKTVVKHGQTGFLVDAGSVTAFAERAWRILADDRFKLATGSLAACSSQEFSWDRSASELLELYTSVR